MDGQRDYCERMAPTSVAAGLYVICVLSVLSVLVRRVGATIATRRIGDLALGTMWLYFALGSAMWVHPDLIDRITSDVALYDTAAAGLAGRWAGDETIFRMPGAGKEGFVYALAGLYWAFGHIPHLGLALNSALLALCIPIAYDTTRRLFGQAAAKQVLLLFVIMPGLLIWGTQLHREQSVYFLLTVGSNIVIRLIERSTLLAWIALAATILLLSTVRSYVAVIYGAAAVATVLIAGRERPLRAAFTGAVVAAAIGALAWSSVSRSITDELHSANYVLTFTAETANSGFSTADVSTITSAVDYLLLGFPRFLLGPLPGSVSGASGLLAAVDTLTWWAALALCWRAASYISARSLVVVLAPAIAVGLAFTLIVGNYGMVLRHRTQLLVLLMPLIAVGLSHLRGERGHASHAESGPGVSTRVHSR
jgi:hypothetical protein